MYTTSRTHACDTGTAERRDIVQTGFGGRLMHQYYIADSKRNRNLEVGDAGLLDGKNVGHYLKVWPKEPRDKNA